MFFFFFVIRFVPFFWTIFLSLSCNPLLKSIGAKEPSWNAELANFFLCWWHDVHHILAGIEPLRWILKPDLSFWGISVMWTCTLNSSTFVIRVNWHFIALLYSLCMLQSGWANQFTVLRALEKMVCSLTYWTGFLSWLVLWLAFRPVVMQEHARQSDMAIPFPEKESNRSVGSTLSGLSFYIDTDISPELQRKVGFIKFQTSFGNTFCNLMPTVLIYFHWSFLSVTPLHILLWKLLVECAVHIVIVGVN